MVQKLRMMVRTHYNSNLNNFSLLNSLWKSLLDDETVENIVAIAQLWYVWAKTVFPVTVAVCERLDFGPASHITD